MRLHASPPRTDFGRRSGSLGDAGPHVRLHHRADAFRAHALLTARLCGLPCGQCRRGLVVLALALQLLVLRRRFRAGVDARNRVADVDHACALDRLPLPLRLQPEQALQGRVHGWPCTGEHRWGGAAGTCPGARRLRGGAGSGRAGGRTSPPPRYAERARWHGRCAIGQRTQVAVRVEDGRARDQCVPQYKRVGFNSHWLCEGARRDAQASRACRQPQGCRSTHRGHTHYRSRQRGATLHRSWHKCRHGQCWPRMVR